MRPNGYELLERNFSLPDGQLVALQLDEHCRDLRMLTPAALADEATRLMHHAKSVVFHSLRLQHLRALNFWHRVD